MKKYPLFLMIYILTLTSCNAPSDMKNIGGPRCESITKLAGDKKWVGGLLDWADREVLGRTFPLSVFSVGGSSGPGYPTNSLSFERSGVHVPHDAVGYSVSEIRILWSRHEPVEMVYLKLDRGVGVLVGRQELNFYHGVKWKNNSLGRIKEKGRIGIMCYSDDR